MKFAVSILRRAQADADRFLSWITERSPQGVVQWQRAYKDALLRLRDDAGQHGLAPENVDVNIELRQKFFKTRHGHPYRLLYTILGNEVRVLRVRGPGQAPVDFDDIRE